MLRRVWRLHALNSSGERGNNQIALINPPVASPMLLTSFRQAMTFAQTRRHTADCSITTRLKIAVVPLINSRRAKSSSLGLNSCRVFKMLSLRHKNGIVLFSHCLQNSSLRFQLDKTGSGIIGQLMSFYL